MGHIISLPGTDISLTVLE